MEEYSLQQPELVGREKELTRLKHLLDNAMAGKGSTVFISGEAGIGKTRLVSELIRHGGEKLQVIQCWCLAEGLEPLMPVKSALREAGLFHLISGEPPPLVISAYLMNDAGILISKAEKEESGLDSDIFTSMLKAVGDFVQDSLSMMGKGRGTGLNSLGYEKYRILVQTFGRLSLAIVMEGSESEFLINDMKKTLAEIGNKFDKWGGDPEDAAEFASKISWFVSSGKYNGKYLIDDPKIRQENVFDNVLLGMQRLSSEKPVLLFLDDMQWADPTTLNLLHYLARNTMKDKVLLLGAYRPEDIVQGYNEKINPLENTMQNMSREGLLEKMELKRLGARETEKMIVSALGKTSFDRRFYDNIYKETEGTPFFVLEVMRLLQEEGCIKLGERDAWTLTADLEKLDIPTKVYDVVKRRLDRLMKEQRKILDCASVVGEEFQSDIVGKVMGINRMELLENLSEIEKTHKLIHSFQKKYVFDHAKVREVLYKGIMEELRQEYHRTVADTIVSLQGGSQDEFVGKLAYHYSEANDQRAGHYLIMTGDKAMARFANEEAIRFYIRALDFIGPGEQPGILEKLGDIEFMLGEYDKAGEYFEKIRDTTADKDILARMLRKLGEFHTRKGNYEDALKAFTEARSAHQDALESARLSVSEGHVFYLTGKYDKAMSLFLEAFAIFEKSGAEPTDKCKVLRALGNTRYLIGDYDQALSYFEKSLDVIKNTDDIQGISAALNNIGVVHMERGDMDKALEFYEKSYQLISNIGAKTLIAQALNNIGLIHNTTGHQEKALEYMKRGLEIERKSGNSRGIAESLNNIGVVYVDMGEKETALEYYLGSTEIRERIGDRRGTAFSYFNLGNSYADKGEHAKAVEYYHKSLDLCQELGDISMLVYNHDSMVAVSIDLGDIPKALEHAKKAVEKADELGRKFETGMSRRAIGMVYREMKDWNKAAQEFEKALAVLDQVDTKKLMAQTLYEYAVMHKAKSENDLAKEKFGRALSVFEEMGMKYWAGKCKKGLEEL
jgi:tetratricopeptide (TPR) repeat protein